MVRYHVEGPPVSQRFAQSRFSRCALSRKKKGDAIRLKSKWLTNGDPTTSFRRLTGRQADRVNGHTNWPLK